MDKPGIYRGFGEPVRYCQKAEALTFYLTDKTASLLPFAFRVEFFSLYFNIEIMAVNVIMIDLMNPF